MPRKTRIGVQRVVQVLLASMRPRPDAAENDRFARVRMDPLHPASMRPRPDAAENDIDRYTMARPDLASMRPRPDAAENAPTAECACR